MANEIKRKIPTIWWKLSSVDKSPELYSDKKHSLLKVLV